MDFGKLFSLFVKHPTIFKCWCFSLWSVEPKVCDLIEIWVFSWIIYIWVLLTTLETCVEEIFFGESLKRQEFFIDFKTILWHCRDLMFYADDTLGSILHYITSTASAAWCWNSRYEILESMAVVFFSLSHRFPIISFFFSTDF